MSTGMSTGMSMGMSTDMSTSFSERFVSVASSHDAVKHSGTHYLDVTSIAPSGGRRTGLGTHAEHLPQNMDILYTPNITH